MYTYYKNIHKKNLFILITSPHKKYYDVDYCLCFDGNTRKIKLIFEVVVRKHHRYVFILSGRKEKKHLKESKNKNVKSIHLTRVFQHLTNNHNV